MIILVIVVVVLLFGVVVFVGAPYLPTLSPQAITALDLLDLKAGDTLLELGCGDGKVLKLAAERGLQAVGIEMNPILACVSWVRTRRYKSRVRVVCGNFWRVAWPESDAVYVFLIPRFMPKLDEYMQNYGGKLVSIAFAVPNKKLAKQQNGVYLYRYTRNT